MKERLKELIKAELAANTCWTLNDWEEKRCTQQQYWSQYLSVEDIQHVLAQVGWYYALFKKYVQRRPNNRPDCTQPMVRPFSTSWKVPFRYSRVAAMLDNAHIYNDLTVHELGLAAGETYQKVFNDNYDELV